MLTKNINNTFGINNLNSLTLTDSSGSVTLTASNIPSSTINTTSDNSNTTCYIPFSKTTAGNNTALFLDDSTTPLTYNPSTSTLTATNFNGSASGVTVTEDNSNLLYPVMIQGSVGNNKQLYADIATTPFAYSASTGTLSPTQLSCSTINQTAVTNTCSLWTGLTTGSVNIASTAQTTGSITLGSTTTTTGLCNIRPPLVLSRQLQTTNNATYLPNAVNHLGYTFSILGALFLAVSLPASTNVNLYNISFTSANYGTYLFICNTIITPSDTTIDRQVEISISTATATIQAPHFAMQFIPKAVGSAPQLTLSRVIQIYADTTVYLVGYCQGSSATVQTTLNNGLFSYTRIA